MCHAKGGRQHDVQQCPWPVITPLLDASRPLPLSIPKESILSTKTTACAEMLEAEKLGGGLGLTVAVMYERLVWFQRQQGSHKVLS